MAEVAPAKKAAGAAKARKPAGLSVTELLMQVVAAASKERGGISLAALKKSLAASGYDMEKNSRCLKLVLRSLVTKGTLLQIKGTGASGSFKLNKKQADPKDKAARKKKQQQAAGAKKPSAAKKAKVASGAAGAKKPVKKAVKKPASVGATKPKKPKKSPTKPLKAKAKAKPKAAPKKK